MTAKKYLHLIAFLFFCGCGSQQQAPAPDDNHGYGYRFDAITPSGLRIRYDTTLLYLAFLGDAPDAAASMDRAYSETEQCTGLTGPAPLVIIVPLRGFLFTYGTHTRGYTFLDTNTVLIPDLAFSPDELSWILRHEFTHIVLNENGYPADRNAAHDSPLFSTCEWH